MFIRIRFPSEAERIKGNYVLLTNTFSRRLRGDIFEIEDRDRKLLDDHQIHYEILPLPDANGSPPPPPIPPPFEVQRRNSD
jgi:hypothetical protein